MEPINAQAVSQQLATYINDEVFLHLETTQGAYTKGTTGAFARNLIVRPRRAGIGGQGPFRVGIKIDAGWIYAEGLTHWQVDAEDRLLLAGHDEEGHLTVALQLGRQPFPMEGQDEY